MAGGGGGTLSLGYSSIYGFHFCAFQIEQLQSLAEESQQLRDEMDVLRHTQEKVVSFAISRIHIRGKYRRMTVRVVLKQG